MKYSRKKMLPPIKLHERLVIPGVMPIKAEFRSMFRRHLNRQIDEIVQMPLSVSVTPEDMYEDFTTQEDLNCLAKAIPEIVERKLALEATLPPEFRGDIFELREPEEEFVGSVISSYINLEMPADEIYKYCFSGGEAEFTAVTRGEHVYYRIKFQQRVFQRLAETRRLTVGGASFFNVESLLNIRAAIPTILVYLRELNSTLNN